tara:strand:+ start:69 stop:635 length:567 start_codon:yes stop_codon:yes gene_type:complete
VGNRDVVKSPDDVQQRGGLRDVVTFHAGDAWTCRRFIFTEDLPLPKKRRFTDEEIARIEYLREQGWSYHAIARRLKRDPSSILRIVNGERGLNRRSKQRKPWRCPGCGGRQLRKECLTCEIREKQNARTREKRQARKDADDAQRWSQAIQRKRRDEDWFINNIMGGFKGLADVDLGSLPVDKPHGEKF